MKGKWVIFGWLKVILLTPRPRHVLLNKWKPHGPQFLSTCRAKCNSPFPLFKTWKYLVSRLVHFLLQLCAVLPSNIFCLKAFLGFCAGHKGVTFDCYFVQNQRANHVILLRDMVKWTWIKKAVDSNYTRLITNTSSLLIISWWCIRSVLRFWIKWVNRKLNFVHLDGATTKYSFSERCVLVDCL